MRKLVLICFAALFAIVLQADIVPIRCLPSEEVYVRELIRLLDAPNHTYHLEALEQFAQEMSMRLNGTMIIARHDTILVEHSYGKLQLFKSSEGYGKLSPEQLKTLRNQPGNQMTTSAIFDLASVSKQFTAAAILKLCSEGKVSLKDSLGMYFPELPYSRVTVKQLLTHTSGIPEYFNFSYQVYDNSMFVDNEQLLNVLAQQRYPYVFKRGSRFEYINTNYALLASIVEKVTGVSFEEYVHDNMFEPAGMDHTLFFTELVGADDVHKGMLDTVCMGQINVNISPNYDVTEVPITRGHWRNGTRANYDRLNGVVGDKGIYSNVEDLVRWCNAYFIDCSIIPKEWVEQASCGQNRLSNGATPSKLYGYGLRIEQSPQHGCLIYHGGLWNGYHNVFLYRPKDGLQIIFLSNYYNSSHTGKNESVLQIFDQQDTISQ